MTMGDEAAVFAAAGIPVFPCVPGAKRPLTEHGFEDATTDLGQVKAWWSKWPAANLAMPTGAPLWDVQDIDMKNGESGYPALRRLKQAGLLDGWAHAVQTPSGGLHLYFAGTDEGNHALNRHKIDYRGAGGYVLLPPSIVETDRGPRRYDIIEVRDPGRVQGFNWAAARALLQPAAPPPPAPVHGRQRPTVACPTWSITSATPPKATATTPCSGPPTVRSTTGPPISDRWSPRPSRPGWTTAQPRPPLLRRSYAVPARRAGGRHHRRSTQHRCPSDLNASRRAGAGSVDQPMRCALDVAIGLGNLGSACQSTDGRRKSS